MRLVNPGTGEISDRLSILALKILFAGTAGKDITHFRNEQVALLTQLRGRTLNGKWFEAYSELAAVNAALWHAEDDLRELRGETGGVTTLRAGTLAFRIQELNDLRAACVEKINKDTGEFGGAEKAQAGDAGGGETHPLGVQGEKP